MTTTTSTDLEDEVSTLLEQIGVPFDSYTGGDLPVFSPITGTVIAHLPRTTPAMAEQAIAKAHEACLKWRTVPTPKRGELIRLLGDELRRTLPKLGRLVTSETGKIVSEGFGEVQEMIDICGFAAGLSRQIGGLTLPSELPSHRVMETWHPLGVVGVISAFNFPAAVWSWNAALALVCGNAVVWKPSEKALLTALATHAIFERAGAKFGGVPEGLTALLIGDASIGKQLVDSPLIPLVSATGSTAMGRAVAPILASLFARAILELGGNNAAIVTPTADPDLTVRAIAFSAMGTAGQRCTTLRRLIVHESAYDSLLQQLRKVYGSVVVGDPRDAGTLVGPLIDERSFKAMQAVLEEARRDGAMITGGERVTFPEKPGAFFVRPALVELATPTEIVKHETFAPILYVLKYSNLADAIVLHNSVPQGLSSSIFTMNVREAETFLSATGSDCGIANVNIGTSGAEIGGAFGGEKETGGGRESSSDAWKQYMRRATNTINYGTELPLTHGVNFDIY